MQIKKILMAMIPVTAIAQPKPWFNLGPDEGYVEAVACEDEFKEECAYKLLLLEDYKLSPLAYNFKAKAKVPGMGSAPDVVRNAIESAAEAMGDVSYVHVAVTHKGTTYEYMYNRTTGWNSFRAVPSSGQCRLKCKAKLPSKGNEDN